MSFDKDRYELLTGTVETGKSTDGVAIGDRIRELRVEKGLSYEEMSHLTGFDTGMLKMIEKGEIQPQLGVVVKLSKALDAAFSRLLSGVGSSNYVVTRKNDRKPVFRSTSTKGKKRYTYQSLAMDVHGRHMESLIVTLEENPEQELSVHDGEEFIFVLEGTVVAKIGEDVFELEPGDSLYYLSTTPHMVAAGKERAVVLAVIYEG